METMLVEQIHGAQIAELWATMEEVVAAEHNELWSTLVILGVSLVALVGLVFGEMSSRIKKLERKLLKLQTLSKEQYWVLVDEEPETVKAACRAVRLWNRVNGKSNVEKRAEYSERGWPRTRFSR